MAINDKYGTYADILKDLNTYTNFSNKILDLFQGDYQTVSSSSYFQDTVPKNIHTAFGKAKDIFEKVAKEVVLIETKIESGSSKLDQGDVKILEVVGVQADKLCKQLVDAFDKTHDWKDYGDSNFKTLKSIYNESKAMLQYIAQAQSSSRKLKVFIDGPYADRSPLDESPQDASNKRRK